MCKQWSQRTTQLHSHVQDLAQGRGLTSVYDETSSFIGQKVIIRCFWHATAHHRRAVLAYVFG